MNRPADPEPAVGAPLVWVLLGHKAGDNNQVMALAENLGFPVVEKHMRYRSTELWTNLLFGPNLLGIRKASAAQLRPPWPRLVITAGRRNEPVARWIQRQAEHPVRLVHIGRPWAHPDCFDLIIATPQYYLEGYGNVMTLDLPLHHIGADQLEAATAMWRDRLLHLPEPRIAVLVGGESGGFHLDRAKTRRLGQAVDRLAQELGGSLLISTSPRTPRHAAGELSAELRSPYFLFDWHSGASENPYPAFLAIADRFVVTGESMSMLAEACATRRPVYIFDMTDKRGMARDHGPVAAMVRVGNALRYKALTHRMAQRFAPRRMRRDVGRLHRSLIGAGRAVWLGQEFPSAEPEPVADATAATHRVLALMDRAPVQQPSAQE
jgi:mitochondrial fission protein ELM1